MALDNDSIRGADRLVTRLRTLREQYDISDMMDGVAKLLLERTLDRFDRQVAPDGEPWADLLPTTLARRRKDYSGKPPLVRTGKLRASIGAIKGGSGSVFTNTGAGVRIGIQNPEIAAYAGVQTRGNRHVTARPFLGVSDLDVRAVDGFLRRRIAKAEAAA